MRSTTILSLCVLLSLSLGVAAKLKVLIVYAHQEPKSFCAAMKDLAVKTLREAGHEVQVTDLYAMKMLNRIDRTDFRELYDSTYFRPQVEQANANRNHRSNFSDELRAEHDKSEWADVFLFIYPFYLSYTPGILQAWLERVFSYGFAFGQGGTHLKGKKGMLLYTTGGGKQWVEQGEKHMLFLIQDRMKFWGMEVLDPFGAYAVAYITEAERKAFLSQLEARIKKIAA